MKYYGNTIFLHIVHEYYRSFTHTVNVKIPVLDHSILDPNVFNRNLLIVKLIEIWTQIVTIRILA